MNGHTSISLRPDRAASRRAFTLVELLTVVAIIGVLAVIIMAVIGSARRSSQTATCIANVRQVGVAVLLYVQDNKGKLPGPFETRMTNTYKSNSTATDYDTKSHPYIGTHIAKYTSYPIPRPGSTTVYFPPLLCPAWHAAVDLKKSDVGNNRTWGAGKYFGYTNYSGAEFTTAQTYASIEKPSQDYALREIHNDTGSTDGIPAPYHPGKKRTHLYYDGRVESK